MRWLLLGLAALALERLEQDGLLAEHVGALHRADREPQVAARPEDVGAEEARIGRRADRRRQPGDDVGVLATDRDEGLGRTDGAGGDGGPLDDRERVAQHERSIGVRRRVGAVAVGDDVPAVGLGVAAVRHLSPVG